MWLLIHEFYINELKIYMYTDNFISNSNKHNVKMLV